MIAIARCWLTSRKLADRQRQSGLQQRLHFPVVIEDRRNLLHHQRIINQHPGFVNMLQRAPVKILATDKGPLAINQQVFGMHNPAGQTRKSNRAQAEAGYRL